MTRIKTPTTRLGRCAAAIEHLNETEALLKEINLRTVPKEMREPIKTARRGVLSSRTALVAAMRADAPDLTVPQAG